MSRRDFGLSAIASAAFAVLGSATWFAERGFRPAARAATAPAQDVAFETTAPATVTLANGPSVVNATLGTTFAAVMGSNHSTGAGTGGVNTGSGPGVYGQAASGAGVYGTSRNGRGGVFEGTSVAQIQLTPGGSTHPASGSAGDFYVDDSARLWFCKGGKTWKQLA